MSDFERAAPDIDLAAIKRTLGPVGYAAARAKGLLEANEITITAHGYSPSPVRLAVLAELKEAVDAYSVVREQVRLLRTTLIGMVGVYVDLVNSGNAGFWNPEGDAEVRVARDALSATEEMR